MNSIHAPFFQVNSTRYLNDSEFKGSARRLPECSLQYLRIVLFELLGCKIQFGLFLLVLLCHWGCEEKPVWDLVLL